MSIDEPEPSEPVLSDFEPATDSLREEVVRGLLQRSKTWPCKFLYDHRGSLLFNQICLLDEYYLTRLETWILETHIEEISELCKPECLLLELGSGNSSKTRLLLDHIGAAAYVPIDISRQQLLNSASALNGDYPRLEILPVCADYTRPFSLPASSKGQRRTIVFFPGSTVGNFEPDDAVTFLRRMATLFQADGGMLIGVDLQKPKAALEPAYNDAQGVTAAFNLNLLRRANRELGADFDLDNFQHRAIYNEQDGRIEMHLVSVCAQTVHVGEAAISFRQGEHITTEHSYKYTLEGFADIASRAGLTVGKVWTDPRGWFSVHFLTANS